MLEYGGNDAPTKPAQYHGFEGLRQRRTDHNNVARASDMIGWTPSIEDEEAP